ncbi:MAG: hypothetical protein ACRDF7_07725 [Candidatus Limnocylindrales bacterium]
MTTTPARAARVVILVAFSALVAACAAPGSAGWTYAPVFVPAASPSAAASASPAASPTPSTAATPTAAASPTAGASGAPTPTPTP